MTTKQPVANLPIAEVTRSSLSASQACVPDVPSSGSAPLGAPLGRNSLPKPTLKIETGHSTLAGNRYAGVNQDYVVSVCTLRPLHASMGHFTCHISAAVRKAWT